MAAFLASGTAAADSADFILAPGEAATLCLVDADGELPPNQAVARVQFKSAAGQYMDVARLTASEPLLVVAAAGTYRVSRSATPVAFGVDKA